MAYTLIGISLIFLGATYYTIRVRDILNPILVLTTPITVQYWLFFLYLRTEYPLRTETNMLLIFALVSFLVGFFVVNRKKQAVVFYDSIKKFSSPFLIIGVIGFFIGLFIAIQRGLSGPESFFFNIRYANTTSGQGLGIAAYLLLFLQLGLLILIRYRKEFKTWLIIGVFLLMSVTSFFTMAKTALLLTCISSVGVYLLTERHINKRRINYKVPLIIGSFFLLVSVVSATILGKGSFQGSNFIFSYIAYPITAFDNWIFPHQGAGYGETTIPLAFKVLGIIGFASPQPIELGLTKWDFNAFTFLGAPYLDFGFYGTIVCYLLIGALYGWIYGKVQAGSEYWIIFYSLYLYPLVMSFFEFQYTLTTYVYYFIILASTWNLSKKNVNNENSFGH